jgi:hypothetical protein
MDSSDNVKPKRVLTEAQRLAFLKGREKRMANIEKNRLAKLEFQEATKEEVAPPVVAEEKKNTIEELIPSSEQKPVVIPPMPKLKRQKVVPATPPAAVIDEDKIASIVADKIIQQMKPPPPPPRKPRTPKMKTVLEQTQVAESKIHEDPDLEKKKNTQSNSNVPPFVHNFSWL